MKKAKNGPAAPSMAELKSAKTRQRYVMATTGVKKGKKGK